MSTPKRTRITHAAGRVLVHDDPYKPLRLSPEMAVRMAELLVALSADELAVTDFCERLDDCGWAAADEAAGLTFGCLAADAEDDHAA